MQRFTLLLVAVVAALTLAACGGSAAPAPKEITLRGQDIKFDLNTLEATKGQTIKLTYINEGALDHNFLIDELNVKLEVKPGETKTIEFTPASAGEFKYHCNVPGHTEAGMVGTLVVKP